MGEATALETSDRLPWSEIQTRHFGEWVLLMDVEWVDEVEFEVRSAVVCAHSKSRRETLARVKDLPAQLHLAHFFIDEYA